MGVHPQAILLERAKFAAFARWGKGIVTMRVIALILGLFTALLALPTQAQDRMWLQIEAQPDLETALDRARAYASLFPDVEGYRLDSGWYGIALGPQDRAAAEARLLDLRAQNLIPIDSFLADGSNHGQRFWPAGAQDAPAVSDQAAQTTAPEVVQPLAEAEESLARSRAAEAALGEAERMELQEALQWYGFYSGGIDGAFGRGTRASMAAWQEANGHEATGVLSTAQRQALVEGFLSDRAEFGFEPVIETESGIEITLPMGLIGFDHYEPPFVHYLPRDNSGLRVLLISEPGGASALAGLYDVIQTLEIVPPQGERLLEEDRFTIRGQDDRIETLVHAEVHSGNVKGYLVSWNRADGDRMSRVLPAIAASFRSLGDQVLDPGLVPLSEAVKRGLLAGLEVRHPIRSRSGFFVDAAGTVVTTAEAVQGCGKLMLERTVEASLAHLDSATGIAVLTPATPLAPAAVAQFALQSPRPGSLVALSGYSYEDKLPAPVMTPGVVEETQGLNGEPGLTRLTLAALPGDQGGPVLDGAGDVLGMLVPVKDGGKQLPEGVTFAASSSVLLATLAAAGLTPPEPQATTTTAQPSPDALAARARGMTVLVSCWE